MRETKLRPSQEAVLEYTGGRMGISAVPGSGKTFTLSYLAAMLVERLADAGLTDDQEVLIVTFTNPAVNTFRSRIARLVQQERGLLPYIGYRVRTLHGLAHDIVRTRPGLVGLSEGFEIIDDRVTGSIIRELAENWVRVHGDRLIPYLDQAQTGEDMHRGNNIIRRKGAELVESVGYEIIKLAKDNQWEPGDMRVRLDETNIPLPLAEIGIELYEDYQRSLSYRGGIDFDDLVRLAMLALQSAPAFLERLQVQWPYILEDEAQDSSQLQNEMLSLLSGNGNWVRVGDPNQAIFTTFTTADSNLLRRFLNEEGVIDRPLRVSGRSSPSIIRLANQLVGWVGQDKLVEHLRTTFYPMEIVSTEPGDPQTNPEDGQIYLDWDPAVNITPEREIERVVQSIEKWLPDHPEQTVAILVPENSRGFKIAETFKDRSIAYEELLRSTTATRDAAARLQVIFEFLADPTNSRALARLYGEVWWLGEADDPENDEWQTLQRQIVRALQELKYTEDFLWPGGEGDWLADQFEVIGMELADHLERFRDQVRTWLQAASLPVDQLVLTMAQTLFDSQADLALAHKIAVVLRGIADNNPDYRLPELSEELRLIAQNQRRFLGFEGTTSGYEPQKGLVTVATMHAAKGLEWDRVYLMSANNYSFPAGLPGDSYIAEKWFIRDELNMQAEAARQAGLLMDGQADQYEEGLASREARLEYAAERMRLFYVGITRARQDLVITWNMGRFWRKGEHMRNKASAALIALTDFWKKELQS